MEHRARMSLALLFGAAGSHPASWLHPESHLAPPTDLAAYTHAARTAERGLFDLFFIADTPAARTENLQAWSRFPLFMNVLEPVTLLTALAGATTSIGLGGTVSTSFSEPYNVARQFASLDHISAGRAAWNVVTSANDYAARNFGHTKLAPHADRYRRAGEFVDVVRLLWDSWDDQAFELNRATGRYFNPAAQHPVHHQGEFFRLDGALNIARSPQGHPVLIAAGASDTGQDLAARTAEVVFSSNPSIEDARQFTQGLKSRMAKFHRDPSDLKVLAGLPIVLAETDAEAADDYARLQELVHPDVGRFRLGMDLETDLSDLPLDEPIPEDRIPKSANFHKGFFDDIIRLIRDGRPTLREVFLRYERGRKTITGGPQRIADIMEEWFTAGAADGFMLQFHIMPRGLDLFVARVVPELQRRGLLRTAYTGTTLRDHLGLQRPARGARLPQPTEHTPP
jgi:FMN-dependent oxidoreductase (nitrilotriacetate monooxygenase family)